MKIFFKWMPNFKHHRVVVNSVYVGHINPGVGWYYQHLLRQRELMLTDNWSEVQKVIDDKITALNVRERLRS